MLIQRSIKPELLQSSNEYPIVTILGPRQSGKTTLVKMVFPNKTYRSLEDPDVRRYAKEDPRGFLNEIPDGAILDEIQRFPELLSYLQGIVDKDSRTGLFIITGSHLPELKQAVSQTLAGRTAILKLLPFSYEEISQYKIKYDPYDLCCLGLFPRIHDSNLKPSRFYSGYVQTYVERDVRALVNIKDLDRFQVFLNLLSGRIGNIINYTSLSNDVGVSATTIKNWISVLKASFIIFEVYPYYENIRKRVIKSSKIYFCDVGLVCFLLGIHNSLQLKRDPLRGGIYENLIISEILKKLLNKGIHTKLHFYRDSHGNEVDLVIRDGRIIKAIEIKSASTFTTGFISGIKKMQSTVKEYNLIPFVCYNGKEKLTFKDVKVINPFLHNDFNFILPE